MRVRLTPSAHSIMLKSSQQGIVEVFVLLITLSGLATYQLIKNIPTTVPPPRVSHMATATAIPTKTQPTPSPFNDPVTIEQAIGINLTQDLKLNVSLHGVQKTYSVQGFDGTAGNVETLQDKISGKPLYLVTHSSPKSEPDDGRYVFLSDMTLLTDHLQIPTVPPASPTPSPKKIISAHQLGVSTDKIIIPSATPSPTVTPTASPMPKPTTPRPSALPTAVPTVIQRTLVNITTAPAPERSLNPDLILQLINRHRQTKNLAAFQKDEQLCKLAQSRAPELYNEIFVSKSVHNGLYARSLPYWITENMAHYDSEEYIVSWWLRSWVHRAAIEGDKLYSCGACSGNSCTQLFTSYIPK